MERTTGAGQTIPPPRATFLRTRHQAGNVLLVLASHALLIAWFAIAFHVLPLLVYVPLSVAVALVHQRAMSEWIHEAAHFNLVGTKRWNDLLGNVLAGVWFAVSVARYRATHFQHHALNSFFRAGDRDTALFLVGTRRELVRALLRDVSGITVLAQYVRFGDPAGEERPDWGFLGLTALAQVIVLTLLWMSGRLDAWLLYYGALVVAYPVMNRVRTYGQHAELEAGACILLGSTISRTMDTGILGRLVVASPRLLYHREHHRWPHLPWRALHGLCVADDDPNGYATSYGAVLTAVYRGLPR